MRYVFIVNPTAGKGNLQEKIINRINNYFAAHEGSYKIKITQCRGDARLIAKREAETGDKVAIFACGGEGTSFEVINGVCGFENAAVGVIPCGSANDFLKYFGGNDAFSDIENQISGSVCRMDLIKAGNDYCLNGCSAGMDAMVAHDMVLFKRWPFVSGSAAYKLAIVKTFMRRLGITVNIKIDGEDKGKKRCLFAVIANAPFYGGGYMGAPDAVPNDGMLDFTQVGMIKRLHIPKFLSLYQKGRHGSLKACSMQRCKKFEFVSEKPIPVNMDGEIVFADSMSFEIVPDAINFLLPKTVAEQSKILTNF